MDPSEFSIDGEQMTEPMCEVIKIYLEKRELVDDFLEAIVCNDLKTACIKADWHNKRRLHVYVSYFYNFAPSTCWGSVDKVRAWLAHADPVSG